MTLRKTSLFLFLTAATTATFAASGTHISASGRTLASSTLATDVLNKITDYNRTSTGCADLDAVRMEVLPRNYVPQQPAVAAAERGGHFERWQVEACGKRQQFQIGLWPSSRGGSDFAVTPMGRPQNASPSPVAQAPATVPRKDSGSASRGSQAPSLASWNGRYVWEESLGRIGGSSPAEGVASFVTYTLALGPGEGATSCTLNAEGFQTYMRMLCTGTPAGSSITIKFYKPAVGNTGRQRKIGERLLTLSRDGSGIVTQLEALTPSSDASPRKGRMFDKVS